MMYDGISHYTIEELGGTMRIEMPSRKNWLEIFFIGFEIVFLLAMLIFVVITIFTGEGDLTTRFPSPPIIIINSFIFLVFGASIFADGLWQLMGKEVVEVDYDYFVVRHLVLGFEVSKKYPAEKVEGVFVSRFKRQWLNSLISRKKLGFYNFKRGSISLNVGKSIFGGVITTRFGAILDEAEARQIVAMILGHFPQYKYKPKEDI
jgi:hypothetical protein